MTDAAQHTPDFKLIAQRLANFARNQFCPPRSDGEIVSLTMREIKVGNEIYSALVDSPAPETAAERDRLKTSLAAVQHDCDDARAKFIRASDHEAILSHQLAKADATNAKLLEALQDARTYLNKYAPQTAAAKNTFAKVDCAIAEAETA